MIDSDSGKVSITESHSPHTLFIDDLVLRGPAQDPVHDLTGAHCPESIALGLVLLPCGKKPESILRVRTSLGDRLLTDDSFLGFGALRSPCPFALPAVTVRHSISSPHESRESSPQTKRRQQERKLRLASPSTLASTASRGHGLAPCSSGYKLIIPYMGIVCQALAHRPVSGEPALSLSGS